MNLSQFLLDSGIDIARWSHDCGNKNLADLQREIEAGESQIESIDGTLTRVVRVATVAVRVRLGEKLFLLVEDKQIFFTGGVRQRQRQVIAEKMYPSEPPLSAAQRALKEEIGLDYQGEFIALASEVRQQNSPSYPGLASIYQTFNYQIFLSAADLKDISFVEVQENKISLFTLELETPISTS
jgi:ADP-ribose pyrophosphatase YjhB (NUDIX family)